MKIKTIDLTKLSFYISFFMIEFSTFAKNITFISNYCPILTNISICLLIFNSFLILSKLKINIKKWILYIILFTISLMSYFITKESLILQLFLLIICSSTHYFDDIIRTDLKFKIIILIFIVFFHLFGFSIIKLFWRSGKIRYAFGFSQPNTFGYYILSFFFEFMYYIRKKITIKKLLIYSLLVLFFLNLANSRTAEISIALFVGIYIFTYLIHKKINYNSKDSNKNIIIYSFSLIFIFLTIISFIFTNLYINGNNFALKYNEFFSDRLLIQSHFTKIYSINILGNNIDYFDTLDNVYIRLLINFGVIGWLLYNIIYFKIIKKANNNKDTLILIIFFVLFIYGFMEWYIIRPVLNIFLIYCSAKFRNEGEINE